MHKIIVCTYDERLVPIKKTPGSVCRDLRIKEPLDINAKSYKQIGTGIKTYLPIGRCTKVYARSGLPAKMGLMLANGTAVFDADYRGEYIMQLFNFTEENQAFETYTRMSQLEFAPYYIGSEQYKSAPVPKLEIIVDKEQYKNFETLYPSIRGEGRFNSIGSI